MFLVMLGTSSFSARNEVHGKTIGKYGLTKNTASLGGVKDFATTVFTSRYKQGYNGERRVKKYLNLTSFMDN